MAKSFAPALLVAEAKAPNALLKLRQVPPPWPAHRLLLRHAARLFCDTPAPEALNGPQLGGTMNDRFRHQRNRHPELRNHSESGERRYSSDYDETYGSEWQRGRAERFDIDPNYRPQYAGGYTDSESSSGGWYGRGSAGMYGAGGRGGYSGGRGGSGYGSSTGTDYGGGLYGYGGYANDQTRFGGGQSGAGAGRGTYGHGHAGDQARFGGGQRGAGAERGTYDHGGYASEARPGGGFAGRGPKGYSRTDERIREDVCERLSRDDEVDAGEIEVSVQNGEVTLQGTVQSRSMKRQAEDLADDVPGVTEVHNRLRVIKGVLNELKDKLTGKEGEQHYANSGTKTTPADYARR
jgi:hypothetical protein